MRGEPTRELGGVGGETASDFLHAADLRGEHAEVERVQGLEAETRGGDTYLIHPDGTIEED